MIGRGIERTMVIGGLVTPAFIHNGGYYFVNLGVYADGLVACWELVDLPLFEEQLRTGWVATGVPDGDEISVHGLGAWVVEQGRWTLVGGMKCSILPLPDNAPVRLKKPSLAWAARIKGERLSIFAEHEGRTYLADLRVFADGTIEIGRLPAPRQLSTAELSSAIRDGSVFSKPAPGAQVEILGGGSFTVGAESWAADAGEILEEVADHVEALNGRPSSIDTSTRTCPRGT
jgi:hypothetical protein